MFLSYKGLLLPFLFNDTTLRHGLWGDSFRHRIRPPDFPWRWRGFWVWKTGEKSGSFLSFTLSLVPSLLLSLCLPIWRSPGKCRWCSRSVQDLKGQVSEGGGRDVPLVFLSYCLFGQTSFTVTPSRDFPHYKGLSILLNFGGNSCLYNQERR